MDGISGVEMHYYAICLRKLWLFHRGIRFEEDGNERITAGKIMHENSYSRMDKEFAPDEDIRIDRQDGDVLREIKLTSKMEAADRLQMLYYLYVMKSRGITRKGMLSYPAEKKTVDVILDDAGEARVKKAMMDIQRIVNGKLPKFKKLPYCGKCAYKDFCLSGEADMDGS